MSERLQKFLARAGVASRRHAEGLITAGRVTVNNQRVTELGTKVEPTDLVTVDGTLVTAPERTSWYLLHKPPGVVTTLSDPEGRPTVAGLLEGVEERVFPVGRLDWDAEGALLLTNDGASAHRLLHPSFEVPRTYLVKVKGAPTDETLARLREGVRLEDGPARALRAERFESTERNTWLLLQVGEGRPHLVKRLSAAVGHPVVRLFRPAQAGISVAGLQSGEVRPLTPEEVQRVEAVAAGGDVPEPAPFLPPRRHGRAGEDDDGPVDSGLPARGESASHGDSEPSRERPFRPGKSGLNRPARGGRPPRARPESGGGEGPPGVGGKSSDERRGGSWRSSPGADRGAGRFPRRGPSGDRAGSWRGQGRGGPDRREEPRKERGFSPRGARDERPARDRSWRGRGGGPEQREESRGERGFSSRGARDGGAGRGGSWRGEGSPRRSGRPGEASWRGAPRREDREHGAGGEGAEAPWRKGRNERGAGPVGGRGRPPWRGAPRGADRGERAESTGGPDRRTSWGRGGSASRGGPREERRGAERSDAAGGPGRRPSWGGGGSASRGGPRGERRGAESPDAARGPGRGTPRGRGGSTWRGARDAGAGHANRGQGGAGNGRRDGNRRGFGSDRSAQRPSFAGPGSRPRPGGGAPGRGPGRGPPHGGGGRSFGGPGAGKPRSGGRGRFGALPRGPRGGGGRGRGRP